MSATEGSEGSAYLVSQVGGLDEVERLRRQASLALAAELGSILRTLPPSGVCLDIGSGSGLLADAIARARPDARVQGIDADALAVGEAQRRFGQGGPVFHRASIHDAPPADWPLADVAVLRLVLMHLPRPVEALRDARRWIKPDGLLHVIEGDDRALAMEPEQAWLAPLLDLMEAVQAGRGGSRRRGRELEGLLRQAGWIPRDLLESSPDPALAARNLGPVFQPVAEFYLKQAEQLSLATPAVIQELRSGLRSAVEQGLKSARVPLYHAIATL